MYILRIEHPVPSYEGWKKAFESDPAGREKNGVKGYHVLRPVDDANYVMIDLEFEAQNLAEAFLESMRAIWGRVEGKVMTSPKARIVEIVETGNY